MVKCYVVFMYKIEFEIDKNIIYCLCLLCNGVVCLERYRKFEGLEFNDVFDVELDDICEVDGEIEVFE